MKCQNCDAKYEGSPSREPLAQENITFWMSFKAFFKKWRRLIGVFLLVLGVIWIFAAEATTEKYDRHIKEQKEKYGELYSILRQPSEEEQAARETARALSGRGTISFLVGLGMALKSNKVKYNCPKCKKKVQKGEATCRNCGQAFDWSKE